MDNNQIACRTCLYSRKEVDLDDEHPFRVCHLFPYNSDIDRVVSEEEWCAQGRWRFLGSNTIYTLEELIASGQIEATKEGWESRV